MPELSVGQVAVGAWLCTTVASVVALLTATVLPRWVKIGVRVQGHGQIDQVDVGLWQTCHSEKQSEFYNCTLLDAAGTTGWFHNAQIIGTVSCVTSICCAASLCLLVIRFDCWRIRRHLILHLLVSAFQVATGLLMLTGVILCGVNISHQLPICVSSCPPHSQPMTSCPTSGVPSTTHCLPRSASSYVIAAVGSGLVITSGVVGAILSRQLNGDDGEPLLDGIADVIVTSQAMDGHVTD